MRKCILGRSPNACAECYGELYEGDTVYECGADTVHEDCITDYILHNLDEFGIEKTTYRMEGRDE